MFRRIDDKKVIETEIQFIMVTLSPKLASRCARHSGDAML